MNHLVLVESISLVGESRQINGPSKRNGSDHFNMLDCRVMLDHYDDSCLSFHLIPSLIQIQDYFLLKN